MTPSQESSSVTRPEEMESALTTSTLPLPAFVPLTDARAELGESPVWSPAHVSYSWVDIIGRRLFRTAPDGETQDWATPEIPGFVQCVAGAVFVGMESGIFSFDPGTGSFHLRCELRQSGVRFNDACTDPQGRIWAGTMDLENRRHCGVLYRFDTVTGALVTVAEGFLTVNGLAWDAARNRLYLSDSHPSVQTVWTCALQDDGTLGPRTLFADFHPHEGRPDGAALDAEGTYWIAGVGGARLYRFAADGALMAEIEVPVASPTKPAFGPGGEMVVTSFADDGHGGRLLISRHPQET